MHAGFNAFQGVARRWPLDIGGSLRDTVLIAGVGRSGTTWLADLINFDGCYRDLFEPFHPWLVPAAKPLKGHWYQRAGDKPPAAFVDYVSRVLRGRVRDSWIDRFNRRLVSRRRLVKAIRANLFLGWLADHYPQVRIVLLIRHPAAVVRSRLGLHNGWQWRPTLLELFEQRRLMERLSPYQRQLALDASGLFDEYLLTWSISHWIPLSELSMGSALPVYYERLVSEPEAQMQRVLAFIGRTWDRTCLDLHGAPSKTGRGTNRDIPDDGLLELPSVAWLGDQQRVRLRELLNAFELGWLYDESGHPACSDDAILTGAP